MTPEQIAFRGIIYGGAITLAGTFLVNAVQVFLQWRQHKWGISAEKKKIFAEKRLGALQGAIQLCDFLSMNEGKPLDDSVVASSRRQDWERIRRENLASGGLLPHDVQQAFQAVVFSIEEDSFRCLEVDTAAVQKLRKSCLEAIHREFESD
jgi:hypothetical protein